VDLVAVLLIACFSLHLHSALHRYAFDDAYIHFRIAAHLVRGGEPYYNVGEPVMVSTAPAWTLVLAPLFAVQDDPRGLVAALNALATTAAAWLFVAVLRELTGRRRARLLGWAVAIPYLSIALPASLGLMETALAMLVLAAALSLFLRGRPAAFPWLGAAPFLRPELALLSASLLVHAALRDRARAGRALAATALGALPFLVYDLYFFGTVIPSAVEAKSVVYDLSGRQVFASVIGSLAPPLPAGPAWVGVALFLGGFALLATLVVLAVARGLADERERVAYLLLFVGLLVASAYVTARTFVFPWYAPLFAWPITLGFCAIVLGRFRRAGAAALLVLVVAPHALLLANLAAASLGDPRAYPYFAENARVRKYLEVGRRLHRRHPDARLLAPEIGGLGYGFAGRILDAVGLASPEALRYHPMAVPGQRSQGAIGAVPVGFVEATRPELIVSLDVFIEAFLKSEIRRDYVRRREPIYLAADLRRAASPTLWRSRALNVFVRRDLLRKPAAEEGAAGEAP
jgi:MFS family permease